MAMAYSQKKICIILLMAERVNSSQIGVTLLISEDTVSKHRERILNKSLMLRWNHFMAYHGRTGQLNL